MAVARVTRRGHALLLQTLWTMDGAWALVANAGKWVVSASAESLRVAAWDGDGVVASLKFSPPLDDAPVALAGGRAGGRGRGRAWVAFVAAGSAYVVGVDAAAEAGRVTASVTVDDGGGADALSVAVVDGRDAVAVCRADGALCVYAVARVASVVVVRPVAVVDVGGGHAGAWTACVMGSVARGAALGLALWDGDGDGDGRVVVWDYASPAAVCVCGGEQRVGQSYAIGAFRRGHAVVVWGAGAVAHVFGLTGATDAGGLRVHDGSVVAYDPAYVADGNDRVRGLVWGPARAACVVWAKYGLSVWDAARSRWRVLGSVAEERDCTVAAVGWDATDAVWVAAFIHSAGTYRVARMLLDAQLTLGGSHTVDVDDRVVAVAGVVGSGERGVYVAEGGTVAVSRADTGVWVRGGGVAEFGRGWCGELRAFGRASDDDGGVVVVARVGARIGVWSVDGGGEVGGGAWVCCDVGMWDAAVVGGVVCVVVAGPAGVHGAVVDASHGGVGTVRAASEWAIDVGSVWTSDAAVVCGVDASALRVWVAAGPSEESVDLGHFFAVAASSAGVVSVESAGAMVGCNGAEAVERVLWAGVRAGDASVFAHAVDVARAVGPGSAFAAGAVGVVRKTDARAWHWVLAGVGGVEALVDDALDAGDVRSAVNALIVVFHERSDGAVRLFQRVAAAVVAAGDGDLLREVDVFVGKLGESGAGSASVAASVVAAWQQACGPSG